jgi:hypothetical protein
VLHQTVYLMTSITDSAHVVFMELKIFWHSIEPSFIRCNDGHRLHGTRETVHNYRPIKAYNSEPISIAATVYYQVFNLLNL